MSWFEDNASTIGQIGGGIAGGVTTGGAGVGAGAGIGGFIGNLLGGPAPGVEFARQMEGNGWANDQWARDYGAWLKRYKPDTWASGDIWDNWPQPTPFRQAWNASGGVPLDANLKPFDAGAVAGSGSGTTGQTGKGGAAGPTVWYWPWQPNAFKLAGPLVMLAWAGIFIGVPLTVWALFFRRKRRKMRRVKRSV